MELINVSRKQIGINQPCFIIAEIGTNHNHDIDVAKQLIDVAAEAGVDAVKFQTFRPTDIVHPEIPANAYGHFKGNEKYWYKVLEKLVLPEEWYPELWDYSHRKGLIAISTASSPYCVDFLMNLNIPAFKVASMDLNYFPLLEKLAKTKKSIILSTGMSYLSEIDEAIRFINENGNNQVMLTYCVSNYPAKSNQLHLKQIPLLAQTFQVPVGFSDHSLGINTSIAAVAIGAKVIEKHFTLDRKMNGPDHSFSLQPDELKRLVSGIREVESALSSKYHVPHDLNNRHEFRRSIVTKTKINNGDKITLENIQFTRPGNGIEPKDLQKILGKTVTKDLAGNTVLKWEYF
jgi:N-acetylneuraminate synthase/N,N'-diacetyllegionaminate synthase